MMNRRVPLSAVGLLALVLGSGCVKDELDPPPVTGSGLVINEFLASNSAAGADENGEFDDWVELYNPTAVPQPLHGLFISDDGAEPTKYQLEAPDSMVPPGGFVVIWCDNQPEQGPFHTSFALSAGGEEVVLADPSGRILDQWAFGAQSGDISEGRNPDGGDDWQTWNTPTPGAANTPGQAGQGRLVINEFLASNDACCMDEHGEFDDWLELYNAGTAPVLLNGLYISDDAADPTKWRLEPAADSLLAPGAFAVVWCDNATATQGPFHAGFAISGGGEDLVLTAADGVTPMDSHSFGAQTADRSTARIPDGGTSWVDQATPTPGSSNQN
jgi:hypothetical protein